jgi:glutamate-1-semialdehyde 2,1-aminomutase
MLQTGLDRARVEYLHDRELADFVLLRPRSSEMWERAQGLMPNGVPMSWMRFFYEAPPIYIAEGHGSRFRDVDGIEYADFNIADMSMFCGYGPEPVVAAVARRVAEGSQFMLPSEDALWVADELAQRYGLPKWQFTLSASGANVEAIRLARAATGRDKVLLFDGKYHGHFDDALVELRDGRQVPEEPGLPPGVPERTRIVQFNDPGALRSALEPRDVAIVLTEPALTNVVGLLLPDPDFHAQLRAITRETGTVLAYDETHTQVTGPGGLTRGWGLEPDVVTMGKSIAGGIPLGAYGMSEPLADVFGGPVAAFDGHPPVASGGTLFGNPLSMAASRAALSAVLTDEAYAHSQRLGARLADGIQAAIQTAGLPWIEHRLGPRSGVTFAPELPRNALEAYAVRDVQLMHTMWTYLANRGVWDALIGAGPTCSVAASDDDVDRYVAAFGDLLGELTA